MNKVTLNPTATAIVKVTKWGIVNWHEFALVRYQFGCAVPTTDAVVFERLRAQASVDTVQGTSIPIQTAFPVDADNWLVYDFRPLLGSGDNDTERLVNFLRYALDANLEVVDEDELPRP